jgi:ATP-dependent helicase/nuclease subunit A
VYTEYPFSRQTLDEGGAESSERVLRGDIDLLYQIDGTWTLIDFKSDRVDGGGGRHDLETALGPDHEYRRQVRTYVEAWGEMTGEPVETAGLWFADAGEFVPVQVDAGVRAE